MNLLEDLQFRGLLKGITDEKLFVELLEKKATLYCGFDPTAPSLHIGHLVPIMMLARFQKAGHQVLPVVGGGTGLIGDPSGRNSARKMLTLETALTNAQSIKKQLSSFIDFNDNKAILLNNYDWLSKISFIEYLNDYGTLFPVNFMLAKDTVASRLETGITYTEFSYMIVQSIDFYNLYNKYNCQIQLGGSDQWGNITSGVELIHRKDKDAQVVGVTMPLITKSDGTKFGKSSSGTLWLDAELTSPYEIYQYFLNTPDADVIHYLKVFTFLTKEEISEYQLQVQNFPQNRLAQKTLAATLITIMHGKTACEEAIKMSQVLFSGNIKELNSTQLLVCFKGVKTSKLSFDTNIVDVLVNSEACSSKREAREFLKNGSISLNGEKINEEIILTKKMAIDEKIFVIRRGKKNYHLIEVAYE